MKTDNAEINFLMTQPIGEILTKGLAQTYLKSPQFPIDFLANWLLNHNHSKKQESEFTKNKKKLLAFKEEQELKLKAEEDRIKKEEQEKNIKKQRYDDFLAYMKVHKYPEELIAHELPEFFKSEFGLTGVYVAKLEQPTIGIDIDNDEQYAHLDPNNPKVLSYLGADESHSFMKQYACSQEQGVNSKIFKSEVQEDEEQQEVKKEEYIYVSSVVQEPKMHFFRFPKLGAYLAVPLKVNYYFSETTFNDSLEQRIQFKKTEQQYNIDQEERERTYNEQREQLLSRTENAEELAAFDQTFKDEQEQIAKPEDKEFVAIQDQYIFCFDNLGQDSEIPLEQRQKILELCNYYKECWENQQKSILNQNIEAVISYNDSTNIPDILETMAADEASYVGDNFQNAQNPNESELYNKFKMECLKQEFQRSFLQGEQFQKSFSIFLQFRQIRFQSIIQVICYQLLYTKQDINIKNTNILDWKNISKKMPEILEGLLNYEYCGAKPKEIQNYMKLNRQIACLDKIVLEEVQIYNFALSILYKFIKLTLQLRKQDIELRRQNQARLKEERIHQISTFEQHQQELDRAKAEQVSSWQELKNVEPETEDFDMEKWEAEYLHENPAPVIPEEVIDDIDNDVEGEQTPV